MSVSALLCFGWYDFVKNWAQIPFAGVKVKHRFLSSAMRYSTFQTLPVLFALHEMQVIDDANRQEIEQVDIFLALKCTLGFS